MKDDLSNTDTIRNVGNADTSRNGDSRNGATAFEMNTEKTAQKTEHMTQITKNIAEEINVKHEMMLGLANRAIETRIEIGLLLQKQKEIIPHGEWGAWCRDNLTFDQSQAGRYMQIAEGRHLLLANPERIQNLGMADTIKEIQKLKTGDKGPNPLDDLFALAESLGVVQGVDFRQVPKVLNEIRDLSGQQVSRIREWETTLRNGMKKAAAGEKLSKEEIDKMDRILTRWHQELSW